MGKPWGNPQECTMCQSLQSAPWWSAWSETQPRGHQDSCPDGTSRRAVYRPGAVVHGWQMGGFPCSIDRGTPKSIAFSIGVFHEINHPAIKGYPHDYGNLHMIIGWYSSTRMDCHYTLLAVTHPIQSHHQRSQQECLQLNWTGQILNWERKCHNFS